MFALYLSLLGGNPNPDRCLSPSTRSLVESAVLVEGPTLRDGNADDADIDVDGRVVDADDAITSDIVVADSFEAAGSEHASDVAS